MRETAIQAMKEVQQYHKLGTIEQCNEARIIRDNTVMTCCTCTICGAAATAYAFTIYGKTSSEIFNEMEEMKERAIEAWNKRM